MTHIVPIILIPGLGASPRTYAPVLPDLWKSGTVIIANQTQHSSIESMAEDIMANAPGQFALIGHSMGGYIAFEIMRQAPKRVLKLALLNSSARPDNDEAKDKRTKQIEKARHGGFSGIIEAALPAFVHPAHKDDAKLKEIITAAHHDAGAEAYIRQQTAIMGRKDSRPGLKNITIPTLVLTGDGDTLIPPEISQEIANGITGAKFAVIPQSGHMAVLEQPQQVSAALAQWLA